MSTHCQATIRAPLSFHKARSSLCRCMQCSHLLQGSCMPPLYARDVSAITAAAGPLRIQQRTISALLIASIFLLWNSIISCVAHATTVKHAVTGTAVHITSAQHKCEYHHPCPFETAHSGGRVADGL